jgi:SAM-dependent methyltransferase
MSTQHDASESMIALKNTGISIVVLLLLQTLWLGTSHSQHPGSPTFDKEVSKQEAIYKSQGEKVPEGYVTDRSLLAYAFYLSFDFDRSLANLGPADRWLDIGAGEGQAVLDYYTPRYDSMHVEGWERRGKKARAVAISIEDRRTPRWHETAASLEANQIQYLFGKRLREYSLEELGRFQLITDVIGGFSYTRYVSVFMQKVLSFLELNGRFYTFLLDVLPEHATNRTSYPDTLFLTEIENADGSEVKVCSWLKSITCVEVTCESRTESDRPVELYRIHKVCNNVTVPDLVLRQYESGTPPPRRYQLRNPSPEFK